jgi:hypothetical protein
MTSDHAEKTGKRGQSGVDALLWTYQNMRNGSTVEKEQCGNVLFPADI